MSEITIKKERVGALLYGYFSVDFAVGSFSAPREMSHVPKKPIEGTKGCCSWDAGIRSGGRARFVLSPLCITSGCIVSVVSVVVLFSVWRVRRVRRMCIT